MIHELLSYGADNAITGRQLSILLNCDIRKVTAEIKKEREQGQPICATARGCNAGYYLASNQAELDAYCNSLLHRGRELFKTRRALLRVSHDLKADKEQEAAT